MSREPLSLRSPGPGDLPAVLRLEQLCFDDPWPPVLIAEELVRDLRRRSLLAECAGEIVGYLMAWVVADEYHVVNVGVDPGRRREGVATRLLEAGLEEALAAGCVLATLEVRDGNEGAIAFYERHGFRLAGRRAGYYADNGEDARILTRPLASD